VSDERVLAGAGGTAVGAAVDLRTSPPSVAIWIEAPGAPTLGTNISPSAARELAARLTRAAGDTESTV
jgi:hypothetical protein